MSAGRKFSTVPALVLLIATAIVSFVAAPMLAGSQGRADEARAVAKKKVSPSRAPGDVNGDGRTDVRDLVRLRDITLKRGVPASAAEIEAGDLNGDGRLDSRDVEALRQLLLAGGTLPPPSATFGPTKAGLASALGLDAGDIEGFRFAQISGNDSTADMASAVVDSVAGGVLLSTGLAADGGAGDADLLGDGLADSTRFNLTLRVPPGMKSLLYSSRFSTTEFGSPTPNPDWAQVGFSTGVPSILLASVGGVPTSYRLQVRAVDVSAVSSVTLSFLIADGLNGSRDSGLRLSHFSFTASEIATAGALAAGLLNDPALGAPIDPQLQASSGDAQLVDVLSAGSGSYQGSVLLTTGLESDRGVGDTDLAEDGIPDTTVFSVGIQVPQDGVTKSLVFTSQFLSSEMSVIPAQRGSDQASLHYEDHPSGSGDQDLGSVQSSSGVEQPPVTRAVNVDGAQQVRLTFKLADASDQGRRDSGLLISGLYFSQYAADLLANPRPADSQLHTGSYAYSQTLLAASGSKLPFGFLVHYDSSPRRTSGRMGPSWGHSYDWGVTALQDGSLDVRRGDGSVESFKPGTTPGAYVPGHGGIVNSISKLADGSYLYETKDQLRYAFDAAGNLQSISDPNGNSVALHYGADGLLSDLVDTRSQTATFVYDANKLLTEVHYASRAVQLHYDAAQNLVGLTDPAGNATAFTYDGDHDLLTGVDANGITFVTNRYDDQHRVVEQYDAKGARSVSTYTSAKATRDDRDGNPVTTEFDPLDRAVALTDGRGGIRRYTYDDNDNRTSETDPLGAVDHSTYDEHANLVQDADALSGLVTTTYDAGNRPLEIVDQTGKQTTSEYDANGNLLRRTNPLGFSSQFTYGPQGLLDRSIDRNGNVTRFTYTPAGDLATITNALGGVQQSTYDEMGRVVATHDALGNGTFFSFDLAGRVDAITDALGGVQRMTYDAGGRLLENSDPLGAASHYGYSATGQVTETTDPSGAVTRVEYDGEDLLTAAIDALGRRTSYSYDANLRLAATVDALGGKITTSADAANNLINVTDPNGHTLQFEFDAVGRCLSESDPLGNRVSNTYDARSRVTSVTNGRGQTLTCDYDDAARMTAIHLPGRDISLVLDANGNRVATAGSDGKRSERAYNALNRLVRFTDVHGNTIRYQYDAVGNLTALTYSDGATVHYTYDALHRMTGVTDWAGRTTSYQYDAAGHVTATRLPDGSGVTYQYDAAGRLLATSDTAPTGTVTFSTRYTLGPSGLRMAEESTLPLEPELTSGERDFTHNAANQIVADDSTTFAYDADGNMTHGVVGRVPVDLAYDAMNRLVSAGASQYEYDDEGLRVGASVNGWTVSYVQDPSAATSRVLEEHDARGRIVARYVYGLGLISRHQLGHRDWHRVAPSGNGGGGGGAAEHVSVYHFDSRGSTVALTNLHGQITDRYAYDPFGLVVARDGDTPNPYTYDGRDGVMDDGNGLYFMRSRYYEPRLMRFVSRDGVVLGSVTDTQSLNRYAYVLNNPIHAVDPNGQWFGIDDLIMAIGGAVVNVVAQVVADAITHHWSGWEDYTGAAVGGAVWGETLLYTASPVLAGAAGAAAGNGLTQGLRIADGKQQSFDVGEFVLNVGVGAACGLLPGVGEIGEAASSAAGEAAERGASKMLQYIGKSWASRGLASSAKAALKYASDEFVHKFGEEFLTHLAEDLFSSFGSGSPPTNPVRPEDAAWVRMLRANRSTAISIMGTVRPELLLPAYAPITATEGGR